MQTLPSSLKPALYVVIGGTRRSRVRVERHQNERPFFAVIDRLDRINSRDDTAHARPARPLATKYDRITDCAKCDHKWLRCTSGQARPVLSSIVCPANTIAP